MENERLEVCTDALMAMLARAEADPPAFLAVTTQVKVVPASAGMAVYVFDFASAIGTSPRSQANVMVGSPDQPVVVAVSKLPTAAGSVDEVTVTVPPVGATGAEASVKVARSPARGDSGAIVRRYCAAVPVVVCPVLVFVPPDVPRFVPVVPVPDPPVDVPEVVEVLLEVVEDLPEVEVLEDVTLNFTSSFEAVLPFLATTDADPVTTADGIVNVSDVGTVRLEIVASTLPTKIFV
jgi:hypothetical protein